MRVFFFNDTATTEIYTLSLHDALPIYQRAPGHAGGGLARRLGGGHRQVQVEVVVAVDEAQRLGREAAQRDRKSTRLNSSHSQISYAVFCLKKKKNITDRAPPTTHLTVG